MNTARKMLAAVCALCAVAGCNHKITNMPPVGVSNIALPESAMEGLWGGSAFIGCVTWDNKPMVVIWSDAQGGSCGFSSGTNKPAKTFGTLSYRANDKQLFRAVAFSGEIESKEKGQITIDGETHDLAKGGLFLVSGAEGNVHVKQMSTDVSTLNPTPGDVVVFGKAHPEIAAFFSKPATSR